MIWYLITPPERPNLTAGASKTVWVQGFLANRQKQTLDDASVPNCFHGGSADTTRILLQTCNTIVPFYRPGGVNRLVAFPKGQHESHFDCRARAVQRKGGKPIPPVNPRRNWLGNLCRTFLLSRRTNARAARGAARRLKKGPHPLCSDRCGSIAALRSRCGVESRTTS